MRRTPVEVRFEPDVSFVFAGAGLLVLLYERTQHPEKDLDMELAGATMSLLISVVAAHVRGERNNGTIRLF